MKASPSTRKGNRTGHLLGWQRRIMEHYRRTGRFLIEGSTLQACNTNLTNALSPFPSCEEGPSAHDCSGTGHLERLTAPYMGLQFRCHASGILRK